MEFGTTTRNIRTRRRISTHSYERLLVIGFAVLAIISPLFIDRYKYEPEDDDEDDTPIIVSISSYLPLLLLILIVAIALCSYLERGFNTTFDPYLIYRVVGSSSGIVILLLLLSLVLKFKASSATD